MFNSAVLEVSVGVTLVFLLVSTICTAIREGIEAKLKTRAAYLESGIREILQDTQGTGLARAFYQHPLIFCLYSGKYQPGRGGQKTLASGGNLPSYLSGRSFAMALLDIVARGPSTDAASGSPDLPPVTLASIRRNVGNLGNPHLQRMLLIAIDSAEGDLERVRENLHTWFDDSMGRVSGWYKRSTQKILFVIALVVVVGLNVNTITIAQYLYRNDLARAELISAAERSSEQADSPRNDAALAELLELELPIGWDQGYGAPQVKPWGHPSNGFEFWNDIVGTVFGLLLTVFAAMLGAPFWFDVLGRVTAVRSTKKPQPSAAKAGEPTASNADTPTPALGSSFTAIAVRSTAGPEANAEPTPPPLDDGDACDHHDAGEDERTRDEDLPPARGGVAPV